LPGQNRFKNERLLLSNRFVPTALLLGNFVIGTSIMAPAAMLNELSRDLTISIAQASLLVTLGAVVICLGSPLLSWATSRMGYVAVIVMIAALALIVRSRAAN
jgi:MFS transporter, DHA1 family, inner membrane transport protein